MMRLSKVWAALFESRRAGDFEPLLWILLIKAIRNGFTALTCSTETFRGQDAFSPSAIAVEPIGWASWLPVNLVLSQEFERGVGLIVMASAALWLLKRWLAVAPVVCASSYGLLMSLALSREFNYRHQELMTVWALIVFALVYGMRRHELPEKVRQNRIWTSPSYPVWAVVLIGAFLGSQYTYSGLQKLLLGGLDAGSGLTLQVLLFQVNGWGDSLATNRAAQFLVDHRSLATLAMTSAVVLETLAIAAFSVKQLRSWWALGLLAMHISVMVTMHIPFIPNMIVLLWLAIPSGRLAEAIDNVRRLFDRLTALTPRFDCRIGPSSDD